MDSASTHMAAEDISVAASLRSVRRSRSRRRAHAEKSSAEESDDVEEKIVALQKIVPGGERLLVTELFEETAEYILALECRVKALRFLAGVVQSSEKRKRKLAG